MSEPKNSQEQNIFPTYGVHNPPKYSPCEHHDCIYPRKPGEPSDPTYPKYWSAKWVMYRVFNNYSKHMPPYDGRPPEGLIEGKDYQVSYGETYYDSTWEDENGEVVGAMMEHYIDWSLPIFPMKNNFTSSFISLGNTAYFLTYDKDRPKGMQPICIFSELNHPPRRDFIKHLPYSKSDSEQLDGKIQGYSFWTGRDDNPPVQVGASPDLTKKGNILFGYAFNSNWEPDAFDKSAPPYRHPQSFYFSGFPGNPPNAPIVSQNYTEFSMKQPDPKKTWDLVKQFAAGKPIPKCSLFQRPSKEALTSERNHPTWAGN